MALWFLPVVAIGILFSIALLLWGKNVEDEHEESHGAEPFRIRSFLWGGPLGEGIFKAQDERLKAKEEVDLNKRSQDPPGEPSK